MKEKVGWRCLYFPGIEFESLIDTRDYSWEISYTHTKVVKPKAREINKFLKALEAAKSRIIKNLEGSPKSRVFITMVLLEHGGCFIKERGIVDV